MLDSINNTIEPCDDFFEFACRGWLTKNPIPQNEVAWDPMSIMRKQVGANLKAILDAPDKKEDGRPIKLARAMYRTCMDWSNDDEKYYNYNEISVDNVVEDESDSVIVRNFAMQRKRNFSPVSHDSLYRS